MERLWVAVVKLEALLSLGRLLDVPAEPCQHVHPSLKTIGQISSCFVQQMAVLIRSGSMQPQQTVVDAAQVKHTAYAEQGHTFSPEALCQ